MVICNRWVCHRRHLEIDSDGRTRSPGMFVFFGQSAPAMRPLNFVGRQLGQQGKAEVGQQPDVYRVGASCANSSP
jgi:hypothetical protein